MSGKGMIAAYTAGLRKKVTEWGADLVGVAEAGALQGLKVDPPDLLEPYSRAVALAVQLPWAVFEQIEDRPTPVYKALYETVNRLLDEIAFRTARVLQDDGFRGLPVPASQVLDREEWTAALSHKAVARMAGLGWQGKNLLLITPQYGSRVRLATVLTDAPLKADTPLENRCGKCMECRNACPAGAIRGVGTRDHYADREEALYFSRCLEKTVEEFAGLPGIGSPICGICIKVCPFSRKGAGGPARGLKGKKTGRKK